jgi:hypothetical protein
MESINNQKCESKVSFRSPSSSKGENSKIKYLFSINYMMQSQR